MANPKPVNPSIRKVEDIKRNLLHPALTSHFECSFVIPDIQALASERQGTAKRFIELVTPVDPDLLTLSCSEASLPGSNLATNELNSDFTGVTQRHAHRRIYDDRADFTFYVNKDYNQILVFERWMQFISGEQVANSYELNQSYRMMYPKSYKTTMFITKFDRTARSITGRNINSNGKTYASSGIKYTFFNAFPVSITSMPVSYDASNLLKCTVSFTYDRYVVDNSIIPASPPSTPAQETAKGVPDPNKSQYPLGEDVPSKAQPPTPPPPPPTSTGGPPVGPKLALFGGRTISRRDIAGMRRQGTSEERIREIQAMVGDTPFRDQ